MAASETTTTASRPSGVTWKSEAMAARRKARYAADRRLQIYGMIAIGVAIGFLALLFTTLVYNGRIAFFQTMVSVDIDFSRAAIDRDNPMESNWRTVFRQAVLDDVGELSRQEERDYFSMFTSSAPFLIRDRIIADPSILNGRATFVVPMSDPLDQLAKGLVNTNLAENQRRVNDNQIELYRELERKGAITQPFNWGLFFNTDSRFPELAGLRGAIVGSFWLILVCFLISFPVGIAAAIYLEEFAPKNRITDLIEININNLAAVPSVVFGLLGLAVFLGWFNLPRSAPLVGGMVLALMTLPTIIIVTRAALTSVPSSIREAALGVGASKHEMIFHHVLPLAMPSILTGAIIGFAHALGETAPLLLIGMNAFITSEPGGVLDAATALPTQIYIWADSPERGFVARTSAAILVLLGFLVIMNGIAIFLRQRFERRW
jgi:phosphate transport system permease protein